MKQLLQAIVGICIISSICVAQNKKQLLNLRPIRDLSKTPFYSSLIETKDGNIVWKEQYKYIDKIDMNWITYLSDGLKINGLLIKPKEKGIYPCIIFNVNYGFIYNPFKIS